jgi:hypothetical protein
MHADIAEAITLLTAITLIAFLYVKTLPPASRIHQRNNTSAR